MKILVFNNDTDRMEVYNRAESAAMPYNTNGTLTVKEFRGSSKSNILWTSKRTMQSWNSQRYIWGAPIPVGFAFKRPYEGRSSVVFHNIMLELLLMLGRHYLLLGELLCGIAQIVLVCGAMWNLLI